MEKEEPTTYIDDVIPKGYRHVPKGNVFITKNCRKLAHEAGHVVYVVKSHKGGANMGIRVPQKILSQVLGMHKATRESRAQVVRQKDTALANKMRVELERCFPQIPSEDRDKVLKHTLMKRSRRVGRTKALPMEEIVTLAVRAYIRHKYTKYDTLLCSKQQMKRDEARKLVQPIIDDMVQKWGGRVRVRSKSRSTSPLSDLAGATTKDMPSQSKDGTSSIPIIISSSPSVSPSYHSSPETTSAASVRSPTPTSPLPSQNRRVSIRTNKTLERRGGKKFHTVSSKAAKKQGSKKSKNLGMTHEEE